MDNNFKKRIKNKSLIFYKKFLKLGRTREFIVLSLIIGLATGFVSYIFQKLIQIIWELSYSPEFVNEGLSFKWFYVLLPALGGLIIGPMVTYIAKEAKGHGVPEVMLAVAKNGGKIRPIVALVKSIASAICIGTGGSAGKEGPIVQIGSALGSSFGQLFKMSSGMIRILVACGAAGGISATFGTPLAGVLFALEVILREFAVGAFSMVVISSVTASTVAKLLLGEKFFFRAPSYSLNSNWELFIYALLGIVCALYARFFVKFLYGFEDVIDKIKIPEWIKPAIGGLLLGILAIKFPQTLGTGHLTTETAIWGGLGIFTLIALSFAKIFATSFTLGSGGSGGIFAPSLFMGAMVGGWFGKLFQGYFPSVVGSTGAYALVGMGALFAGATRAPITAVLIVFEMTNNYQIILPMMIAVVSATLLSSFLSKDTIYTLKLLRRGIDIDDKKQDVLSFIKVSEVMTKEVVTLKEKMMVSELAIYLKTSKLKGFPVLNDDGVLTGLLTRDEINTALLKLGFEKKDVPICEIMQKPSPTAKTNDSLAFIAEDMGLRNIERMPVVDEDDKTKLVGIITHSDILHAYRNIISEGAEELFRNV